MTDIGSVQLVAANDVVIVRLIGEIDLSNAQLLEEEMTRAVPDVARNVVLDLAETTYLDSAGIRMIFGLAETLKHRGQGLRLVVPEGAPVERVLDLTNVGEVVPVDHTLESALAKSSA